MRHPHGFIRQFVPLIAACAFAFPVSAQNPAQNAAQGEMVTLRFPNADVRDVLSQYEILVGKRLVYDNQVQGQVNINVPEVTKEEAIRIIEITLMMNGYHLVPVDSDPNLIKVTGLARSPRQVAVPVYSDPEPIPDNEQVVMYLVKLNYADPTELAQILQQAMPPSRPEYAPNIVALPKSQLLVLTENTAVIRAMKRLIRAADLEPTRVEGEFFTLVRASAKDVVQMLEKLFEKPQQTGAPARPAAVPKPPDGGVPGAVTPQSPAGSPLTTVEIGGMTEDSMLAGKVRLTADERTNRIYVVTRPVNIPVIKKLITEFDQDVPFNEPFVRELKYVSAGDILEALVRAVSDPGAKETGATGATGATGLISNVGYASANFYSPLRYSQSLITLTLNRTYYVLIHIGGTTTFDRIGVRTAGSFSGTASVRVGIYNNSGGQPSTVSLDAGTVSCTAANTTYSVTISHTLNEGWYWLAATMQSAATTSTFLSSNGGFFAPSLQRTTADTSAFRPVWGENSVTGAYATAGTLIDENPAPVIHLRAT